MKTIKNTSVLFIGDIHGKFDWNQIVNDAKTRFIDEIVFLGDYLDSFDKRKYTGLKQLENLKAIIAFKRKVSKNKILSPKITLLLGNHDYAYLYGYASTSGYQFHNAFQFQDVLRKNIDLFDIAWSITEKDKVTLATHAGLTQKYYDKYILPEFKEDEFLNRLLKTEDHTKFEIHEILNYLKDKADLMWKVGEMRGGTGTPGPLWADYQELMLDPLANINQVFGHTANYSITIDEKFGNKYYRIDTFYDNTPTLKLTFEKLIEF